MGTHTHAYASNKKLLFKQVQFPLNSFIFEDNYGLDANPDRHRCATFHLISLDVDLPQVISKKIKNVKSGLMTLSLNVDKTNICYLETMRYNEILLPYLSYCVEGWGNTNKRNK